MDGSGFHQLLQDVLMHEIKWHPNDFPIPLVMGMVLNCLHRVIYLPHPGANDLWWWSAVKHQLSGALRCLIQGIEIGTNWNLDHHIPFLFGYYTMLPPPLHPTENGAITFFLQQPCRMLSNFDKIWQKRSRVNFTQFRFWQLTCKMWRHDGVLLFWQLL